MTDYKLVPVEPTAEMLEAYCGAQPSNIAVYLSNGVEPYKAMLAAAPAVQGEPVGWQFYQDGKWWHGDDRIKVHRKNTEEAGFRVRDVYAAPQPVEQRPEPDVTALVEALECMVIGACAVAVPHNGERAVLQDAVDIARAALSAHRKGGE